MTPSHDAAPHRHATPPGRDRSRGPRRASRTIPAAVAALLLALLPAADTFAATYTYTIANTVIRTWSTGLSWSPGVPVSGSATTLYFTGSLGNGTLNTSFNNLGTFQLSSLSISATGPNTGASSFQIAGDPLQFLASSGSNPSVLSVVSGSTLPAIAISNNIQLSGDLTVDVSPSFGVVTFSGTMSGSDKLTKVGAGKLLLSSDSANTPFTGDTRIGSGDIELGNMQSLVNSTLDMQTADTGSVTFGIAGSNTYMLGGLKGSRGIDNAGNTLSVGGNGQSTTYSGALSGTGGFVKTGTGALTLAGTSTYTGPTTVTSGSLILDGRLANSSVTVQSGALLSGTGSIGGDLTVGGTLSPGSVGALTVSGSVTLQNGATTLMEVTGSTTFDQIIGTGGAFTNDGALVLSIDAPGAFANNTVFELMSGFAEPHLGSFDTVTLFATGTYAALNNTLMTTGTVYGPNVWVSNWVNSDVNGRNGQQFLFDERTGTLALVPEPTTWALAAVAAGMLGVTRLLRRRAARHEAA